MATKKFHEMLFVLIVSLVPTTICAKTFFDYFRPTPIICSPLASDIWGASGVIPRDRCNGLQDQTGTRTQPPKWLYWDGKILRAKDGKYHMFATRWLQSTGHGNWWQTDVVHAVSDSSPIGPYVDKGFAYDNGPDTKAPHKGHNVTVLQLPDSTYALVVSEIVPFTIFTSKSLDGPWINKGHAPINTNGVTINIPYPGDQHLESNVSMVIRHDGNFEIIQRHGIIAVSTKGIMGPYNVQQPTNNYPSNQQPVNPASIFPKRLRHSPDDNLAPSSIENTEVWAEDPLIWYGGGQYHVLYDYPNDRVGYHLTSLDGINDWTDRGFAYNPRQAEKLFSYTDGTVSRWFKMERPNIYVEDGHIKYFTYAVCDVDKNQITGGSNHANNVIVMAFDGKAFDEETGIPVSAGTPAEKQRSQQRSAYVKADASGIVTYAGCKPGGAQFSLYLINGTVVSRRSVPVTAGSGSFRWKELSVLSRGTYILRVMMHGNVVASGLVAKL